MSIRQEIVAKARSLIEAETPWVHQGRSTAGIDCAGVVTWVAAELGLSSFDITNYERVPSGGELIKICDANLTRIRPREMQAGDVAVFRIREEPQHIAIIGEQHGGLTMIHAETISRRVVENALRAQWLERLVAAYRFPGVT